jgi:hypothetical protein
MRIVASATVVTGRIPADCAEFAIFSKRPVSAESDMIVRASSSAE